MSTLTEKLNPTRFTEMSPFMAAEFAYVLGQCWNQPSVAEMTVSETEDLVYFRKACDAGFIGVQSLTDLRNNWNRLLDAAESTPDQRKEAVTLFHHKVEKVPGTQL